MIKLLLGLSKAPSPHDAADALAVAICHVHSMPAAGIGDPGSGIGIPDRGGRVPHPGSGVPRTRAARSWRAYRP
jgi:hypothetical protein